VASGKNKGHGSMKIVVFAGGIICHSE
jgi:hypothetical protein